MSGWHQILLGGLLSLAILFGSVLAAHAELPTWGKKARSASDRHEVVSGRAQASVDPLAQRQVMARQLGFEAQQQGYVSKVQGAASQSVIWVIPDEKPVQASRKSWLASWWDFFGLSD